MIRPRRRTVAPRSRVVPPTTQQPTRTQQQQPARPTPQNDLLRKIEKLEERLDLVEQISTYFATAKDVRIPMFLNKPQFVHELKESVTKYVEPNSRVSLVNPQFLVDDSDVIMCGLLEMDKDTAQMQMYYVPIGTTHENLKDSFYFKTFESLPQDTRALFESFSFFCFDKCPVMKEKREEEVKEKEVKEEVKKENAKKEQVKEKEAKKEEGNKCCEGKDCCDTDEECCDMQTCCQHEEDNCC